MKKLALILLGLSISIGASAAVWMWTDADGVVHYSDYPADEGAVLIEIESKPTNRAAIAEQREETIALERERQQGDSLRREEKAEEKTQRKIDRELAKEKCVKARERYDTYYNTPRLYRTTEDGDFEYLSSEEIDALHAKEMTAISKWCG
ncbi:MAG: DUF4124 domain-containing protein [Gammaproteobacteria bacterium]|nr:DUF4124 domain-containing protein [Gammaproteobacteria bacterium]